MIICCARIGDEIVMKRRRRKRREFDMDDLEFPVGGAIHGTCQAAKNMENMGGMVFIGAEVNIPEREIPLTIKAWFDDSKILILR
mgnify:CR=1 FL=1